MQFFGLCVKESGEISAWFFSGQNETDVMATALEIRYTLI
jgi:hypothetical protein